MKTKENVSIWRPFLVSLAFMMLLFGCFMQPHYSSDSYANLYSIDVDVHIRNGRIVSAFVQKMMNFLKFNPVQHQSFTIAVSLCVLAVCISLIYMEIRTYLNENMVAQVLTLLGLQLIFANVFFAEWLMFVESMTSTCVGLLILTFAIISAGRELTWKRLTLSFVLLLVVLNMYQLYVEFYLTLSLIIVYARAGGLLNKQSFLHSVIVTVTATVACVLTIIFQPMIPGLFGMAWGERKAAFGMELLLANFQSIIESQEAIFSNAYQLLPDGLLPTVLVVLAVILVRECFRSKNFGNRVAYNVIAILMITLLTYAPHIVSSVVWLAPRTLVGVFHIPMYMAVSIGITQASIPEEKPRAGKLATVMILLFLLVNAYASNGILTNSVANNRLDQYCANAIQARINRYQNETGIEIKKLGICNDQSPVYRYPGVQYVNHDLNIRAMNVAWGSPHLINFYCNANYENVEIPAEIYETYFAGKNWDFLNLDEQAVFVGDTLYLAMY